MFETDPNELDRILSGCKAGRKDSFEKLVDLYGDRCFGYFYRLTGNRDQSQDLLQELFLRLIRKIDSFRGGSFDSWIFTLCSNLHRDSLRKKYRNQKALEKQKEELASNLPVSRPNQTEFDELQIQLEQLDPETRELVVKRYYGQLTFQEIAEEKKMPIGTVLSKVHRGIRRIREAMGIENETQNRTT